MARNAAAARRPRRIAAAFLFIFFFSAPESHRCRTSQVDLAFKNP
jgi:hypothetical protein